MRLLPEESVPVRLRRFLPTHLVKTVVEMGWGGVKNGALLTLAAKEFDAFLTVDKNLPYSCHSFRRWSKHLTVCSPVLLYGLGYNPAWGKQRGGIRNFLG
jgi:hypothetical protein